MPIVRIGEKQIGYWIGKGKLSDARETILFIHGAGGGQFVWSYQKAFFEKDFNPIILDLPGHGASGEEGESEIQSYAEHIYSFIRALNLPKSYLVGHSMGGAIAQMLALTHSDAIKGVVLVATGARLKVLPVILEGIKKNFEETIQKITQFAYSRKASPELIERGISELMRCPPDVLYGDFLACDRFNLMNEVERIHVPTLILCGQEDGLTPVKYSEFLHSRIKDSKLAIIPEAGHMVMMEEPGAFNEKIREFLESANPV